MINEIIMAVGIKLREMNRTRAGSLHILLMCAFVSFSVTVNAQSEKKYIRKGNREYEKNNFSTSEISYRKALDKNIHFPDAGFNIGDALYKQNKFEDAGKQFIDNANLQEDKTRKSASFYNLGNSLLKANKVKESIEAYKNSLKLHPDSKETKYNLAYAQDMLKKQEEQQKKQQQDKKDQDKDKNKDQNKDQNKDNKDNKDQKDQNKKDQDQQNNQNKDQNQQKQDQQQQGMSKEDAARLLNAIANDEKNVQEKVKLAKASKAKVRTIKNW
jgi:Ca-activated chloride channel homolog